MDYRNITVVGGEGVSGFWDIVGGYSITGTSGNEGGRWVYIMARWSIIYLKNSSINYLVKELAKMKKLYLIIPVILISTCFVKEILNHYDFVMITNYQYQKHN